jgi:hypothetical protein
MCENALSGTALLVVELGVPAELAPLLDVAFEVLEVSAFTGGANVFADGVYKAEPVSAFEPAEVVPLPEELAAAPVVLAAEFAWMYNLLSLDGSS